MFNRKIFVFRLRFSLRPVHWRIGQHPTRAECGSEEPVDQTSWPGSQQGHWKTTQTIFDMICHENYPIEQIMLFFFCGKICEQIAVFRLTVCRKNGSNSKPPCLQTVAIKSRTSTPIFRLDEFPPRRPFLMKFISFTDSLDSSALKSSGLPKAWASLLELPQVFCCLSFCFLQGFRKQNMILPEKTRHFLDLFFILDMFFIDLHQFRWIHLDFHGFS